MGHGIYYIYKKQLVSTMLCGLHYRKVPTAYHPDFGQVVNYEFEAMPDNADAQVEQTVKKLIGFILEDVHAPVIRQDAAAHTHDPINGIWNFVKPRIRFKQDVDIAEDLETSDPRKHNIVETIIRPADQAILIRSQGRGVEDCDGFTGYTACLLTALGIPVSFATVQADPDSPDYSHIYVVAYYKGQRIPLDTSHGEYPGWECPHGRIREWPVTRGTIMSSIVPVLIVAGLAAFALRKAA